MTQGFVNLLAEFNTRATDNRTWLVRFNFRRPLPPWKELRRGIRASLDKFLESPVNEIWRILIRDRFSITLVNASEFIRAPFVYAGHLDMDAGGWVVSEKAKRKTKKKAKRKARKKVKRKAKKKAKRKTKKKAKRKARKKAKRKAKKAARGGLGAGGGMRW